MWWGPRPSRRSSSPWLPCASQAVAAVFVHLLTKEGKGVHRDTHMDCVGANPFTSLPVKNEPSKRFLAYCAWGPHCYWAVSHPAPKSHCSSYSSRPPQLLVQVGSRKHTLAGSLLGTVLGTHTCARREGRGLGRRKSQLTVQAQVDLRAL